VETASGIDATDTLNVYFLKSFNILERFLSLCA